LDLCAERGGAAKDKEKGKTNQKLPRKMEGRMGGKTVGWSTMCMGKGGNTRRQKGALMHYHILKGGVVERKTQPTPIRVRTAGKSNGRQKKKRNSI